MPCRLFLLMLVGSLPWNPLHGGEPVRVVVLGDSLTAGYGVNPSQAYPARLQELIDASGISARVVNAGVSGDTSAGGLSRIDWVLKQPVDIMLIALGANDGLRGVPVAQTQSNLEDIVATTRATYPEVAIVLAGMKVPPNLGSDYAGRFESVFRSVAEKHDLILIPFLLEGVAGEADLNQSDGIHPNPKGHELVAQHVWSTLKPVIEGQLSSP